MKIFARFVTFVLFVSTCALMLSLPVQAGISCHKINAKGVGQDLGGGSTQARITGGGLLNGTTVASFAVTDIAGTVASFAGTVTFTTKHATLEVTVVGTLDLATGAFNASGPVSEATGKLAGAMGQLTFDGVQNLVDGSFVETVSGEICVDLAP